MKNFNIWLILAIGIIVFVIPLPQLIAEESVTIVWNIVTPKILNMEFPDKATILLHQVIATRSEKDDAMWWINKLFKPAIIPKDFDKNMIALKEISVDYVVEPSDIIKEQLSNLPKRFTNGFFVKYCISNYTIQVIETRWYILIGVLDNRNNVPVMKLEDRIGLVYEIKNNLINIETDDMFIVRNSDQKITGNICFAGGKRISANSQLITSDYKHHPFINLEFETDGKDVTFIARKNIPSSVITPRFEVPENLNIQNPEKDGVAPYSFDPEKIINEPVPDETVDWGNQVN